MFNNLVFLFQKKESQKEHVIVHHNIPVHVPPVIVVLHHLYITHLIEQAMVSHIM